MSHTTALRGPSTSISAADIERLRALATDVLDTEEDEVGLADLARLALLACAALSTARPTRISRQERARLHHLLSTAARGEQAHTAVSIPVADCRTLAAVLGAEVSLHAQADDLEEALDLLREGRDGALEAVEDVASVLRSLSTSPAPLVGPLSAADLSGQTTDGGDVTVVVALGLDEVVEGDLEAFNDTVARAVTGDDMGLTDIAYEVVGAHRGAVLVQVTAHVEIDLDDQDGDWA